MPIVNIQLLSGRNSETLAELAQAVAMAVSDTLGSQSSSIRVLINEVEPTHWSVGGKTKAAERRDA